MKKERFGVDISPFFLWTETSDKTSDFLSYVLFMRRDRPRVCLVLFTTEIIRTSRGCHVTCLDYRYVEVFWYLPVLTFSETSGRSSDLNAPFVKGGGVLLHHRDRSYTRVVRSQNSYGNNTFRSAWTSVVSSKRVPHPE